MLRFIKNSLRRGKEDNMFSDPNSAHEMIEFLYGRLIELEKDLPKDFVEPLEWKPGDDLGISLSCKADYACDKEGFALIRDKIAELVEEYGFKVSMWGSWSQIRRYVYHEAESMLRR